MGQIPTVKLNNGLSMPVLGFGTWNIQEGKEARQAVEDALGAGYRLIDTAKIYGNEKSVGEAIKASKIKRGDIFVTTKLWNSDQGYDSALKAFEESLNRLGLEYVDLYLIHSPAEGRQCALDSWKALEKLHEDGLAKAIGLSNFDPLQTKDIMDNAKVKPAVNQIKFHPFVYSEWQETLEFCKSNEIIFESYSPLARGRGLNNATITKIAKDHKKTPGQIMLKWALQHGTVPIPKSSHKERMLENLDIFDFELTKQQMQALNSLG
jgi:diketogulonate reductase-like aldo/keto reductase